MSNRRRFLSIVAGAWTAALACSSKETSAPPRNEDDIGEALRELNRAASLDIAPDDFELARDYTVAVYRDLPKLRSLVLDRSLDLPIAFSARRGRS